MVADLLSKLRSVVEAGVPLRLLVLFGSQASGRASVGSDVDIGVVPIYGDLTANDESALVNALSAAANAEVDLVRLDQADPLLGREVARSGICIFEKKPGTFARWRARAMSEWIDFDQTISPYRKRYLQRIVDREKLHLHKVDSL